MLSFAALLDLSQMFLLALSELTLPALPQIALGVFWSVGTNVPRKQRANPVDDGNGLSKKTTLGGPALPSL